MRKLLSEEPPHGTSEGLVKADEEHKEPDAHVTSGVPHLITEAEKNRPRAKQSGGVVDGRSPGRLKGGFYVPLLVKASLETSDRVAPILHY